MIQRAKVFKQEELLHEPAVRVHELARLVHEVYRHFMNHLHTLVQLKFVQLHGLMRARPVKSCCKNALSYTRIYPVGNIQTRLKFMI